jgi:type IV pilus assembly protein PilO
MLKTRNSRWTAATGLVCALVLVAAWFLLVGPRRADAADLRDQRAQAAQQNDALQLQIAQLKAQFADLPARQAELAAIRTQLPSKADLPTLIRDLDDMAKKAGMRLTGITPQAPVAVPPAGAPAAGASTLCAVPTTIVACGDDFAAGQYLRLVQTEMQRAFLVTNLTVDRSSDQKSTNGTVDLTLAGQIYVLLDSPAAAQSAVGAIQGAAQGATGSSSSGSSSSGTSPSGTEPAAGTPTPTASAPTN